MKIFECGGHKLILGDVLEVLESEIEDNSIDLIFADPPYNIGKDFNGFKDQWKVESDYLEWSYSWLNLCINKLKANGSLYLMASTQSMPYFDLYLRDRLTILSRIVWYYDSSGVQAKKHYGSLYEPILYCVKDKRNYIFNSSDILVEAKTGAVRKLIDYRKSTPSVYNSEKVPGNVWEFPRVRYRMPEYEEHPTQKPVSLLERIIKASSNEGDTVLDLFAGSFTTSFVAKQLKRQSIAIELQEKYLQIGCRRLQISQKNSDKELMSEVNSDEFLPIGI
ncbi:MAG: adenine-specific DNA-methyltransferase [Richelia sp. CSU_2_1]|nr:adenine-specific DNA-methyltransferase [Microcoleus sp. SU_5_6]NJR22488.1 adenine-specific DNA-methyltransferase [Richelia sp. CSU_2_1]